MVHLSIHQRGLRFDVAITNQEGAQCAGHCRTVPNMIAQSTRHFSEQGDEGCDGRRTWSFGGIAAQLVTLWVCWERVPVRHAGASIQGMPRVSSSTCQQNCPSLIHQEFLAQRLWTSNVNDFLLKTQTKVAQVFFFTFTFATG